MGGAGWAWGGAGGCGTFKTREDPSCPRRNQEGSREHHTGLWLYCTVTVGAVTPPPPPERGSDEGRAREAESERRGPRRRAAEEPSPNSGPRPLAPRPGPAPARPREVSQRPARPPARGAGRGRAGGAAPTSALPGRGDRGAADVPQVSEEGVVGSCPEAGGTLDPERGEGAPPGKGDWGRSAWTCAPAAPPPASAWLFGDPRRAESGGGEAGPH